MQMCRCGLASRAYLFVQLVLVVEVHQAHEPQDAADPSDLANLVGRCVACAPCQVRHLISFYGAAAVTDAVQAIDYCWDVQQH